MKHFRDKHFKRKLIRLSKVKISFFLTILGMLKKKQVQKTEKSK